MFNANKVLLPTAKSLVAVDYSLVRSAERTDILKLGTANARLRKGWLAVLYGVIAAGICAYVYSNIESLDALWQNAEGSRVLRALFYPAVGWASALTLLLGFRTVMWIRYRPAPPADMESAPSVTVIIPAYNEGAMVLKSIESVLASNYPDGKLEVFVVDDGSRDDTWSYIASAAERFPDLVTAVRFPQNRGKRAALTCGFERARGEFVVTLDSDSVIGTNTLLALMGPFRNPNVGAVAGRVSVYNRHEGLIPRMIHIRFLITFDVLRAVESSYNTVYCCPGALTGYRLSAVRAVLPQWTEQTFLGSRCTFGEDRALTNYLLNAGFDTAYQGSAEVQTVVPVTYGKLCKMFLRWDRSYVREELRLMKIVWKRPPLARWITFFDRLITNLQFPVGYGALVLLGMTIVASPLIGLRFLVAAGLVSLLATVYVLRSEASLRGLFYGVLFTYYSTFTMSWIMPYAFFTVRARSWLTR
jgi:hyaluronan synthase